MSSGATAGQKRLVAADPEPENLLRWQRMQPGDVDEVLVIENTEYPHPWTRGNFVESLRIDYEAVTLRDARHRLVGYFVAMVVVDELHLLNITVCGNLQGRGVGRLLLDKVVALSQEKKTASILLEVRPTNARALAVYQRYGFAPIGRRKGYYPAADNRREDAIVMRYSL